MEKFNIIKTIRYSIGIIFVFVFLFTLYISYMDYNFSLSTESIANFSNLFKTSGFILTGFVAVYTLEISIELLEHRRNEVELKNKETEITLIKNNKEIYNGYLEALTSSFITEYKVSYNSNPLFKGSSIDGWIYSYSRIVFDVFKFKDNYNILYLLNYDMVEKFESLHYKKGGDYYLKVDIVNNGTEFQNQDEVQPLGIDYFRKFLMITFSYFNFEKDEINSNITKLIQKYNTVFQIYLKEYNLSQGNGYKYKLEKK